MLNRSKISSYKYVLRNLFQSSAKPISPFPVDSLPLVPPQLVANSVPSKLTFFHQKSSLFHYQIFQTSQIQHPSCQYLRRKYGTEPGSELDVDKEVDSINLKFVEAREEIETAMESKETVYFDEEAECARAAVKEVLDMFESLLSRLPETQKSALQRSMGLKIEQLKAELQQLDD